MSEDYSFVINIQAWHKSEISALTPPPYDAFYFVLTPVLNCDHVKYRVAIIEHGGLLEHILSVLESMIRDDAGSRTQCSLE